NTDRGQQGFGSTGTKEVIPLPLCAVGAVSDTDLIIFNRFLYGIPVKVLIDGGLKGNFVSNRIMKHTKIPLYSSTLYTVSMANGTTCLAKSLKGLPLVVNSYKDDINLLLAPICHDIILGKPWLDIYNPTLVGLKTNYSFRTNLIFSIYGSQSMNRQMI